jgi:hypothetical protein
MQINTRSTRQFIPQQRIFAFLCSIFVAITPAYACCNSASGGSSSQGSSSTSPGSGSASQGSTGSQNGSTGGCCSSSPGSQGSSGNVAATRSPGQFHSWDYCQIVGGCGGAAAKPVATGKPVHHIKNSVASTNISDAGRSQKSNHLIIPLKSTYPDPVASMLSAANKEDDLKSDDQIKNQVDALAKYNLAVKYATGTDRISKNEEEAARLFKLAADLGSAPAEYNLGLYYADGQGGLKQCDQEAARLYKLAADQGYALAEYRLGVLYATGQGSLTKNNRKAAQFFESAAKHGYVNAEAAELLSK